MLIKRRFLFDANTDDGGSGTATTGDTVDKPEINIPKARFDEVNNELKAFKESGLTPAQINAVIDEYYILTEKQKQATEKLAASDKPEKKSSMSVEKAAQAKAMLEELYPGLSKLAEVTEKVGALEGKHQAMSQVEFKKLQNAGAKEVKRLISESGYPEDLREEIEELVANKVFNKKEYFARFAQGDLDVVTDAFQEIDKKLGKSVNKVMKKNSPVLPDFLSGNKGRTPSNMAQSKLPQEEFNKLSNPDKWKKLGSEAWEVMKEAEARIVYEQ